jgi:hypothetical protein
MTDSDPPDTKDGAIVDARMLLVAAMTPRPLTTAEADQVRARIAKTVAAARVLRRSPLANGDEPAFVVFPPRASAGDIGSAS